MTAKVWAIVLAVSDTPEQSISEVARRAGLPVSTTHRLLYELVEGGLLERNPDGRFTVCVELQQLLGPGKRAAHARAVVGSVLEDLCLATRLRARFGVWHPDGVSYLERRPDIRRDMCVSGRRLVPTHATALGKSMLAHAPPHVIANIVERGLPAYTPLTLTTPEQLHKDLIRTRASRFAASRGEWRADEFAIAVPVRGPDGAVVGALVLITDELANRARSPGPALVIAARGLARQLAADPAILPTGSGDAPLPVPGRPDRRRAQLARARGGRVTVAPGGRKLLRLEVRNAQSPIESKPPRIRTRARTGPQYSELKSLVRSGGVHTVCEEAGCPNIYECREDREATFLIGGEQCTRRCDFCQIDTGKPAGLDRDEPRRVAESVATMGLRYSTVTGVARDDLPDGGAWLYAETVRQIHARNPGTGVELLIPDFNSIDEQLNEVFDARPEVLAHNLETVPRIFKRIRPAFRYQRSLEVLGKARAAGLVTKSNLILGMGETPDEVTAALRDLHDAGCEIITITQYLRPSARHHPVERCVKPEEFVEHSAAAEQMGFAGVMAGPLVRSSYRAGRLYAHTIEHRAKSGELLRLASGDLTGKRSVDLREAR